MANQPVSLENIVSEGKFVEYKVNEMRTFLETSVAKKGVLYTKKNATNQQRIQHKLSDIIDLYEQDIMDIEDKYEKTGNNQLMIDITDIDAKCKERIERTIDELIKQDIPAVSKEVIAQRQKQWLADSEKRKREFLKTNEGKEVQRMKQFYDRRQQELKRNAKISIIGKMARGNNYSEQLNDLNEYIDTLEPDIRRRIEKEEQRLVRGGEVQKQKVRERYEQQRAGVIEIHERRNGRYNAMVGEEQSLREHNDRLKQIDENEEKAMIPIDMRTEESIIHMKEQYKYHKRLPEETESFSNESNESTEPPEESVESIELEDEPPEVPLEIPITKQANQVTEPNYDKIYVQSIIHHKISVPFVHIGNNMPKYFKKFASRHIEGKCRKEGFIRPNSTQVVSYSTGLLSADNVLYDVVFSCDVCYPCEDMILKCKIVNITKIGIRGIISEVNNPIVLFISREHNVNRNFEDYEEGEMISIKVIGHRFELNDEYISVIGEII